MNLKEGRIGKQETAAVAWIACWISGIFAMNTETFYAHGNAAYLTTVFSAMLALCLVAEAMRRKRCENLAALYRRAYGRVLALPIGFVTALSIVYAAVIVLVRLAMILSRYIYAEADTPNASLYFYICILVLAWMGLEIIGRTSKLFLALIILAAVMQVIVALPSLALFRLYPLPGMPLSEILWQSVTGTGRYFPALLGLLICGVGVQGVPNVILGARIGATGGGLMAGGMELAIGMAYPYSMLSNMHSPLYRLTMTVRTDDGYLRTDKLLMFFWALAGMLAGGYYAYTASLLYAGTSEMRDVRPAAGAMVAVIGALMLLGQMNLPGYERVAEFLWNAAFLCMLLPPMLAAMLVSIRKEDAP